MRADILQTGKIWRCYARSITFSGLRRGQFSVDPRPLNPVTFAVGWRRFLRVSDSGISSSINEEGL
jgi:hypothetical protein